MSLNQLINLVALINDCEYYILAGSQFDEIFYAEKRGKILKDLILTEEDKNNLMLLRLKGFKIPKLD